MARIGVERREKSGNLRTTIFQWIVEKTFFFGYDVLNKCLLGNTSFICSILMRNDNFVLTEERRSRQDFEQLDVVCGEH